MDIRMPLIDGLQATRLLAGPGITDPLRVVVVTTYVLARTSTPLSEPAPASLVSPSVTTRLIAHFARGPGYRTSTDVPLTERESEVVRAVARGHTNSEITAELNVSLSTVKSQLAGAQRRLGLRNRTQ